MQEKREHDKVIDSPGGLKSGEHSDDAIAEHAGNALRAFVKAFPKAEAVTVQNEAGSITFRPKQPRDKIVRRG